MSISKGIALVTGSAQGIGGGIALRLAKDGYDIALNDTPSKYNQLRGLAGDIDKNGQKTLMLPADVTIEEQVKGMVQEVSTTLGGLDVMVANAGVLHASPLLSTLELGRYGITVNAYAPGIIATPMAASMLGADGQVLSRLAGCPIKHIGQPEDVASPVSYPASKEAHFITRQAGIPRVVF
ncbi:hypothetical protein PAXINDRAFT_11162 [Paxillus involutus ATCC 200175]|nr:hypothetical protein PAXINDRAFT_11162 [Paxillus involutus ATCC 200175]